MKQLFVKVQGGLGNQLFQYAFARKLSLIHGIKLKLDIDLYKKNYNRDFELEHLNVNFDVMNKKDKRKIFYKKRLGRILSRFKNVASTPSGFYILQKDFQEFSRYYDFKNRVNDTYFSGYWQNEDYFKSHRLLLIQELTPKKELSEKARGYIDDINITESVSLHVRRGDYLHNANHNVCGIKYFRKAISYINQLNEKPYFFIFSDDIAWCKDHFRFIKDKMFIETGSAIEDLMLMKCCKHHIISNSSFSWWGAWLSNFEQNIVISPNIWFTTSPENHIAPRGWIRLNPNSH